MSSFRRKPESSKSNYFWMPDQVRHDGFGTFYEFINLSYSDFSSIDENIFFNSFGLLHDYKVWDFEFRSRAAQALAPRVVICLPC